jgi:glutamate racemase
MDKRPIGFFDSGLGGLTCVSPLLKLLPNERVIYFGDTARTPYGSKSPETIRAFAAEISDFLLSQDVKMLVIACNTVSAVCLEDLRARYPQIPVLGIIGPAAEKVARMPGRSGIIGTKVTILSRAYEKAIAACEPKKEIVSAACPALVPLIEEGIIENEIMDLTLRYYLDHFLQYHRPSSLVLGCTHYPLIRANLQRLYPDLEIVDPAEILAARIAALLEERGLLADQPAGENTFYASDLSENFVNMIRRISEMSQFQLGFKSFAKEK